MQVGVHLPPHLGVEPTFLRQSKAQAHHDAAFELAAHGQRIDRATDVMGSNHLENPDSPGFHVHFHFRELGTKGIDRVALRVRPPRTCGHNHVVAHLVGSLFESHGPGWLRRHEKPSRFVRNLIWLDL